MFALNMSVVFVLALGLAFLALGLLWRVGAWRTPALDALMEDSGLPIGAECPELAGYRGAEGSEEAHLGFVGTTTLVLFGLPNCEPCRVALESIPSHPAARHWTLVYIAGTLHERLSVVDELPLEVVARWSIFRFHDEPLAWRMFNVRAAPYFHLISPDGRIVTRGIASRPEHFARLLELSPAA